MIKGKNIKFELVEENEAEMILNLRNNSNLNKFISKIDLNIEKQKEWIREYKKREKEGEDYYFSIKELENDSILGYIRVYNIDKNNKTCEWGSWVMKEDKPASSALESVILIYDFIFNILKLEKAFQSVMKGNRKVMLFHKAYGVKKVADDEKFENFVLDKETYLNSFLNEMRVK